MNKPSDILATKIFNEMFDDEELRELRQKHFIAQEEGYKLSYIATISCELDVVDEMCNLLDELTGVLQKPDHVREDYIKDIEELLEKVKA